MDNIDLIIHALKCHEDEICNLKVAIAELQLRHNMVCADYQHLNELLNDIIAEFSYDKDDYKPIIGFKSAYSAFTAFFRRLMR